MVSMDGVAKGTRSSRRWIVAGVIAIIILCVAGLAVWLRSKSHPAQSSAPPAVVRVTQITSDGLPKSNLVGDGGRLYFNETSTRGPVLMQIDITAGNQATAIPNSVANANILDVSSGSELLVSAGSEAKAPPLWAIPVSGASPRRLGNLFGRAAAWTPTGKLVFAQGNVLYLAEHDGTKPQKLMTASGPILFIRFSPDGSAMRLTLGDEGIRFMIWQARADASQMRPILPLPGIRQAPGIGHDTKVCCGTWTRDGRYFLYEDNGDIWLTSKLVEPMKPVQLTSGPVHFHDPVPSSDGRTVYAVGTQEQTRSKGTGTQDIFAIDLQLPK